MEDLWDDEGKAIERVPQVKPSADGQWFTDRENRCDLGTHARRRIGNKPIAPTKRAAVDLPDAGQSYHPTTEEHDALATRVAKKLIQKKAEMAKLAAHLSKKGQVAQFVGRDTMQNDEMWDEEEVTEKLAPKPSRTQEAKDARRKAHEKRQASKREKKDRKNAIDLRREARSNRIHARHPDRAIIEDDVDDIEALAAEVDEETRKSELRQLRRQVRRVDGQKTPTYGRYHHTPLLPDVQPKVGAGKLRHMKATDATHPALDRLKSVEARGLVPARMRHTYLKRKKPLQPGEVIVAKEDFGIMPE